jgi:hypothetical protein
MKTFPPLLLLLASSYLASVTSEDPTCYDACLAAGRNSGFCGSNFGSSSTDTTTCCSASGESSSFVETLTSTKRSLAVNGCPDHAYYAVNPNLAKPNPETFTLPLYPKLVSISDAKSLAAVGGGIGIAVNGVNIYSCYGGVDYGTCTDWASSAVNLEGDTFDM